MAAHWSRAMFTMWWRDEGTSRMRVTFAPDKETLFRKAQRCHTDGSEIAVYNPEGTRVPLPAAATIPGQTPKRKKRKAPAKRAFAEQPSAA